MTLWVAGREIRRVPLDFDWPIGITWPGTYPVTPESIKWKGSKDNYWEMYHKYKIDSKEVQPPKGKGFQLWETVDEGSPITPVFKSKDELAEFCERKRVSLFGDAIATKEEWLQFFAGKRVGNIIP